MFQNVQLVEKHEKAIQQAGFIQSMYRIYLLTLMKGLCHGLVIPFSKTPVQILS